MTGKRIIQSLIRWLKNEYYVSDLLFQKEIISEYNQVADIGMIQSRSDVIHIFEIKTSITTKTVRSAVWGMDSYYANYRWLLIPKKDYFSTKLVYSTLRDYGIGIILYSGKVRYSFQIKLRAKYIDGNFIEYWPSLSDAWYG